MGSGAIIYISSFIKIGSAIQKLIGGGGDIQTSCRLNKPTFIFFSKERRLKICILNQIPDTSIPTIFAGNYMLLICFATFQHVRVNTLQMASVSFKHPIIGIQQCWKYITKSTDLLQNSPKYTARSTIVP
jgi:hypothetical protein